MENIKLSVIIPVYNASKYIKRTLKSVISQNFSGYEIVLIDNGSKDDTLAIAKKFLNETVQSQKIAKFSFQLVLFDENQGPSLARNKGMEVANGKYFVFVDDDDCIESNFLLNLYYAVNHYDCDSAFVNLIKINDESLNLTDVFDSIKMGLGHDSLFDDIKYDSLSKMAKLNQDHLVLSYDLINLELLMKIPFSFVQLIYNRDIIFDAKLKFNDRLIYGEDTDFALRYLANSRNVHIINKNHSAYIYCKNNDSITSNAGFSRFNFVLSLENLASYYDYLSNFHHDLMNLSDLIFNYRIPKAIFGNMNFLFYKNYDFDEIMDKMEELNLFDKLANFKPINQNDKKFSIKIKLFLLSPKLYYKLWKIFKNNI